MIATAEPVAELEASLEDEVCCEYRRVVFRTEEVTFTCAEHADWIHVHKCCGHRAFVCDAHHWTLMFSSSIRCPVCKKRAQNLAELVSAMYKV